MQKISIEECKSMATRSKGCNECPYFNDDKNCLLHKETEKLIYSAIRKIMEGIYD